MKVKTIYFLMIKVSGLRNCLREICVPVDTCRDSISRFSSETEEHRQVLQDTVVLSVLEIKLLAANDTPLSSSKTTCSISATSCWELKSKGVTLVLDKLRFKAHKLLYINFFQEVHMITMKIFKFNNRKAKRSKWSPAKWDRSCLFNTRKDLNTWKVSK